MSAIFISYAREDTSCAQRLAAGLRQGGLETWLDQAELRGGDSWDTKIRKQIKECGLFVPLISKNTQSRSEGYFRLEWKLAEERTHLMARGVAFIVPVVVDDTAEEDAVVPEHFLRVQWTRLPGGEATPAFLSQVAHLAKHGRQAPPAERRVPFPNPARGRGPLMAAAVLLLAAAAALPWLWLWREFAHPTVTPTAAATPHTADDRSVAVLAFENRTGDATNDYFSDGFSDELATQLMKANDLRVAARTSAFSFKGRHVPVEEIGRALHVANVVDGSVRRSGAQLRINVQLISARNGYQLWSENFNLDASGVFSVQEQIASAIATALQITLKSTAAPVGGTPEAFHRVLQGRFQMRRENNAGWQEAITLFDSALAISPGYAAAWAEKGRAYSQLARYGGMPSADGFREAAAAAQRAVALDPELAPARALLGQLHRSAEWDWAAAEKCYREALALAPQDADIMRDCGALFANIGRLDEAVAIGRSAVELDPLNASGHYYLSLFYWWAQRPSEAEASMRRALELAPEAVEYHSVLSRIQTSVGRLDEATRTAELEPNGPYRLIAQAYVEFARGNRAAGDALVEQLDASDQRENVYFLAGVHATAGDSDRAFELLEQAYARRATGLAWVRHSPAFLPLHIDVRWQPFLAKMGFPPVGKGVR